MVYERDIIILMKIERVNYAQQKRLTLLLSFSRVVGIDIQSCGHSRTRRGKSRGDILIDYFHNYIVS